jgi:Leucine-rich repeat (LRR) protein
MPKLVFFYAANNQITDISPVTEAPALTDLDVQGNPVADMSPARSIPRVNRDSF